MTDKPLWKRMRDAWRDAISGTTLDGLDVRNVSGWQAATLVAIDAERARCLAICDEFGAAKRGDDLGVVRRRIEGGEEP